MADTDKKYNLVHEPETTVRIHKEAIKGGQPHALVEFDNPTDGRFGKLWIPKDQLREMSGVIKDVATKATSLASKAANKLGVIGAISGAFQAKEDLKAMDANPNYINLNTGKIRKKLGKPNVES